MKSWLKVFLFTLGSEINVGSGINIGVGRFRKTINVGSGIIVGAGSFSLLNIWCTKKPMIKQLNLVECQKKHIQTIMCESEYSVVT